VACSKSALPAKWNRISDHRRVHTECTWCRRISEAQHDSRTFIACIRKLTVAIMHIRGTVFGVNTRDHFSNQKSIGQGNVSSSIDIEECKLVKELTRCISYTFQIGFLDYCNSKTPYFLFAPLSVKCLPNFNINHFERTIQRNVRTL